jgi:hypothetical protein
MYVESEKSLNMEQEVNEATAALKGLLGIGGSSNVTITSTKPDMVPAASEEPKKIKKKRPPKKKKSNAEDAGTKTPMKSTIATVGPLDLSTGAKSKKKNQQNKKEKGNLENAFAWSAFQSSPDASKLPIPAFSSPAQERKTVPEQQTDLNRAGASVTVSETATTTIPDAGSPEPDKTEEIAPDSEEPVASSTGVNLAALASQPPTLTTVVPAVETGHAPQVNSPPFNPMQQVGPPMFHQQPQLQHQMTYPPPHQHNPYHHHHQQYPPPPPPGYVTIHVQVPPVLMMPGRQMVVTSPAGYPVQVAVPVGIPPGMFIPVHVPAGPPLHMMPPLGNFPGDNNNNRYYNMPR